MRKWAVGGGLLAPVVATAVHDLVQRKHAVTRNFPVVGHVRFLLERIGPELRQYIVASNDAERPFSRDQRRWVYASSKLENNYFGFGTDNDMENEAGFVLIRHSTLGSLSPAGPPAMRARRLAAVCQGRSAVARGRRHAFRPQLGGQHQRHELRLALRAGGRGPEPGGGARRLHAEHRRGRTVRSPPPRAATSSSRSAPRTSAAATGRAVSTSQQLRDLVASAPVRATRDQAQPGREARPRRHAARAQGQPGDRRGPGHPGRRGLHEPVPAPRVLRRRLHAGLRRDARRQHRAAGRHQVRRRRTGLLVRAVPPDGDARSAASTS